MCVVFVALLLVTRCNTDLNYFFDLLVIIIDSFLSLSFPSCDQLQSRPDLCVPLCALRSVLAARTSSA